MMFLTMIVMMAIHYYLYKYKHLQEYFTLSFRYYHSRSVGFSAVLFAFMTVQIVNNETSLPPMLFFLSKIAYIYKIRIPFTGNFLLIL